MQKHITRLLVKNFLGLRELDIAPGKVTFLKGPNRVGKTTALRALRETLAGGGKKPNLVRVGEEKAEVMLDLGEVAISRRVTAKGNYLDIKGLPKEDTAQAYLDRLTSPLCFNPVDFFTAEEKTRRDMLLATIPCEVTREDLDGWFGPEVAAQVRTDRHGLEVLEVAEKVLVEARREANAQQKAAEEMVVQQEARIPPEFDVEKWREADASALSSQITEAGKVQQQRITLREQAATRGTAAQAKFEKSTALDEKAKALQQQIVELEEQGERLIADAHEDQSRAEELLGEVEALVVPDVSEAQAQLSQFTEAKGLVAIADELGRARETSKQATAEASRLNKAVNLAREKPVELLAQSKLPIEGLQITAEGVTVGGVSLSDLSTSEQLLFALNVARATAGGELKLILVDGVECLDADNLALLMREMETDEFDYFVTFTTPEGEGLTVETHTPVPDELPGLLEEATA